MSQQYITIKFGPNEISGIVATCLESCVPSENYAYSSSGSVVKFTPTQLKCFVSTLKMAFHDDEFDDSEKEQIKSCLKYIKSYPKEEIFNSWTKAVATYNTKKDDILKLSKKFYTISTTKY
jgi:hypothetical protein